MNAEREEREKKKAAEAAKWIEKPCKQCGRTIKYNIEWSNYPNFCPECKEKFEYESGSERRTDAKSRARGAGKPLSITPIGAIFPITARNAMKEGILGANHRRLYSQKMDMAFLITVMG